MIKTQYLVPEVYYNKSRDFQFIGRIYDIIFNYIKNLTNLIYNNPLSKNVDKRFLELLALTLGFKPKHNYNEEQLFAICNCLSLALKNKGNIKSIESTVNALMQSQNIKSEIIIEYHPSTFTLDIYIPQELEETTLLTDLFDYILPAGIYCNILKGTLTTIPNTSSELELNINVDNKKHNSSYTSFIPKYNEVMGNDKPSDMLEISGLGGGRIDNAVIPPYIKNEEE